MKLLYHSFPMNFQCLPVTEKHVYLTIHYRGVLYPVCKAVHLRERKPIHNYWYIELYILLYEPSTMLVISMFAGTALVIFAAEAYLCAILGIFLR